MVNNASRRRNCHRMNLRSESGEAQFCTRHLHLISELQRPCTEILLFFFNLNVRGRSLRIDRTCSVATPPRSEKVVESKFRTQSSKLQDPYS